MDTIKSSAEISILFDKGKRFSSPYFTLIASQEKQHGLSGRAAFIAGKKLGGAVWRNKAKRRLRSVYREASQRPEGWDVLLVARFRLTEAPYEKVLRSYEDILNKMTAKRLKGSLSDGSSS